ncbi:MAG: nucleoside phosphorylase, partial [Terracidiphilus sp.]
KHQAVLVDMEAATVARMAGARGLPFYCFKGISDGYADRLPDFNRFVDAERGELKMGALVAHAAVRPVYWGSLWGMGKNSGVAADGLVEMIRESLSSV